MAHMDLGEVELYYEKYEADKNKSWLLFIHGQSTDSSNWIFQSTYFREQGYNVLLIDLPDSGRSSKFIKRYTVADLAYLLSEFLNMLSIKKVNVVGHSLGGIIAIELAKILEKQSQLSSLILIGTGLISEKQLRHDKYGDYLKQFLEDCSVEWSDDNVEAIMLEKIKLPLQDPNGAAFYERMAYLAGLIFSDEVTKQEGYIDFLVESAKKNAYKQDLGSLLRQYYSPIEYVASYKNLSDITSPILIINGEEDPMIPPQAGYRLASQWEQARVVLLPRMKHGVHLEMSDEVNELIEKFVQ